MSFRLLRDFLALIPDPLEKAGADILGRQPSYVVAGLVPARWQVP
jgi:hypothetical protein